MKTLLLMLVVLSLASCASRRPASTDEVKAEETRDLNRGMTADFFNAR